MVDNVREDIQRTAKRYLFSRAIYDDELTPDLIRERVNKDAHRCIDRLDIMLREIGFNKGTTADYLDFMQYRYGSVVFEVMIEELLKPGATQKSISKMQNAAYNEAARRCGVSRRMQIFEMAA